MPKRNHIPPTHIQHLLRLILRLQTRITRTHRPCRSIPIPAPIILILLHTIIAPMPIPIPRTRIINPRTRQPAPSTPAQAARISLGSCTRGCSCSSRRRRRLNGTWSSRRKHLRSSQHQHGQSASPLPRSAVPVSQSGEPRCAGGAAGAL
jgi:hypothetical protein